MNSVNWSLLALSILGNLVIPAQSRIVEYRSCSSNQADDENRLVIKQLDISPWPIQRGHDAAARFDIKLKSAIDIGSHYEVEVKYRGFPLIKQNGDLCNLDPALTCPRDAVDSATLSYHFTMPNVPISGDMDIQIQIWNQKKEELCCVSFALVIAEFDDHQVLDLGDLVSNHQPINVLAE